MMNIFPKLRPNCMVLRNTFVSSKMEKASVRLLLFNRHFCNTLPSTIDIEKEKKELCNALPGIISNLAEHPKVRQIPVTKDWIEKVFMGTVMGGKISRGLTAVIAYKTAEKTEKLTEAKIRLAHALGWCSEILQAYYVVLDDIGDSSLTRRGKPCWHRREDVGLGHAVNDACLLHYSLYQILKENFGNMPFYRTLLDAINETLFCSTIGQFLDNTASVNKNNYELFTRENYENMIIHKTAYYTYKLPVTLGWILAEHLDEESLKNCEDLCLQLGSLFQMQDDYIDCFGDKTLTGKIGTDIQERKCSWLAVNALSRCTRNQRNVFTACYGSNEPAHFERIKQLYIQLKIPQLYKEEESERHRKIVEKIETLTSKSERKLFQILLNMTYGRNK